MRVESGESSSPWVLKPPGTKMLWEQKVSRSDLVDGPDEDLSGGVFRSPGVVIARADLWFAQKPQWSRMSGTLGKVTQIPHT